VSKAFALQKCQDESDETLKMKLAHTIRPLLLQKSAIKNASRFIERFRHFLVYLERAMSKAKGSTVHLLYKATRNIQVSKQTILNSRNKFANGGRDASLIRIEGRYLGFRDVPPRTIL